MTVGIGVALAAASGLRAHERITTTVTWDREISAIVRARCVTLPSRRRPRADVAGDIRRSTAVGARDQARGDDAPDADLERRPRLRRLRERPVAVTVRNRACRRVGRRRRAAIVRAEGIAGDPTARPTRGAARSGQSSASHRPDVRARSCVPCGDRPAPTGRLVGPASGLGERGIPARHRDAAGRPRGVLGWFRKFDKSGATYWLRTPLDVPAGSTLHIAATVASPRLIETRYRERPLAGFASFTEGTTPARSPPCRLAETAATPGTWPLDGQRELERQHRVRRRCPLGRMGVNGLGQILVHEQKMRRRAKVGLEVENRPPIVRRRQDEPHRAVSACRSAFVTGLARTPPATQNGARVAGAGRTPGEIIARCTSCGAPPVGTKSAITMYSPGGISTRSSATPSVTDSA